MTRRTVAAVVGGLAAAAALGAVGGLGGLAIGNPGRPPVVHVSTRPHAAPTTSTTAPYRGPVAVNFPTADACAAASDDCWIGAGPVVTGNVSARLMTDWIACAQSHAHDGRASTCHVERDADGTRSVYGAGMAAEVAR